MLGVLSSNWGKDETLRIMDIPTLTMRLELPGSFDEFAWAPDSTSLYYLDSKENLYQYNLTTQESTLITQGVGSFSVSHDGKWLGLSIRERFGSFTFRVLDLSTQRIIRPGYDDLGYLGLNGSAWSPVANEVAVIFGGDAASSGKLVVYAAYPDHLQIKGMITAGKTYQRDYGQDLNSVEFGVLAWSPDGQKLLVTRSVSDAQHDDEVLLFDAGLKDYQRLPFENVMQLAWKADGQWLAYVTPIPKGEARTPCVGSLAGEIWLADMKTLKTQLLVTDTMYFARLAWRP